jgi:hypothetical protein
MGLTVPALVIDQLTHAVATHTSSRMPVLTTVPPIVMVFDTGAAPASVSPAAARSE